MHITKEQLQHLAKLAKIEIPTDQEEKYLNDLEGIIWFLETLEINEEINHQSEESIELFEGSTSFENPKELLQNSKHEINNDCISIKTSLNH